MPSGIPPVSIPASSDTETLRKSVEVIVNRLITQINASSRTLTTDLNANGFKIQNLGNPAGQKDAVPLDFLKQGGTSITRKGTRAQGGGFEEGHFGLAIGGAAVTGSDVAPHRNAMTAGTIQRATIVCKPGGEPSGADFIVDILKNGTSIFGTALLTFPNGGTSTTVYDQTTIPNGGVSVNDIFSCDITSIGSTNPGQDFTVTWRWF